MLFAVAKSFQASSRPGKCLFFDLTIFQPTRLILRQLATATSSHVPRHGTSEPIPQIQNMIEPILSLTDRCEKLTLKESEMTRVIGTYYNNAVIPRLYLTMSQPGQLRSQFISPCHS